jgi:hypothetical protein
VTADDLLERLRSLETELHRLETRRNRTRLEQLLHADFVEFGRSGRRYSQSDVLAEFAATQAGLEPVHAWDFELTELSGTIALLTYRSAHRGPGGALYQHTLRSSLWMKTEDGWQMRFHQGTPSEKERSPQ